MARLRRFVAAGWVMITIAGSVAVMAGAVPAASARDVGAIDATGGSDVTAELQALFDRTPDGGVARFGRVMGITASTA